MPLQGERENSDAHAGKTEMFYVQINFEIMLQSPFGNLQGILKALRRSATMGIFHFPKSNISQTYLALEPLLLLSPVRFP